MAVLRRFDCLLENTKEAVLDSIAGHGFSNKSQEEVRDYYIQ